MEAYPRDPAWQMSDGEQAAIEGLLARLRPRLALEIGIAEGASLRHLAASIAEVHAFDLSPPSAPLPENVVFHVGDSHEHLPRVLSELAAQGRNVDFAIVDGDHSATGARQDIEDLLDSPAVGQTVIVIHDIANERVRAGVEAVRFAAWPKVAYVHLDWVPGQLFREPSLENELWYGLGLVVVDVSRSGYANEEVHEQRYFPVAPLLAGGREAARRAGRRSAEPPRAGEPDQLVELRWELEHTRDLLDRQRETVARLVGSPSYRLTAPLRSVKRLLLGTRDRLRRPRRRSDADRTGIG